MRSHSYSAAAIGLTIAPVIGAAPAIATRHRPPPPPARPSALVPADALATDAITVEADGRATMWGRSRPNTIIHVGRAEVEVDASGYWRAPVPPGSEPIFVVVFQGPDGTGHQMRIDLRSAVRRT